MIFDDFFEIAYAFEQNFVDFRRPKRRPVSQRDLARHVAPQHVQLQFGGAQSARGKLGALAALAGRLERLLEIGKVVGFAAGLDGARAPGAVIFRLKNQSWVESQPGLAQLSSGRFDALAPLGQQRMGIQGALHRRLQRERFLGGGGERQGECGEQAPHEKIPKVIL